MSHIRFLTSSLLIASLIIPLSLPYPVYAQTITESGAPNYIPKFTGTSSVGNSIIFDSGKVGIGTTNPNTTLDVNGSMTIRGNTINTDPNLNSSIQFGSRTINSLTGNMMTIYKNTTPLMSFGLDTDSGSVFTGNLIIEQADPSSSNRRRIRLPDEKGFLVVQGGWSTSGGSSVSLFGQNYNKGVGAGNINLTLGNVTSSKVWIYSGGSVPAPKSYLDNAGGAWFSSKVGIGTTTPSQLLDVKGGDLIVEPKVWQLGSFGTIYFGNNDNFARGTWGSLGLLHSIYGWNFETGDGIKMTLLENGSIGIGTRVPTQKLDIVGGNGRVQSGYSWLTNSDIKFKTNITTLTGVLEKIDQLRGVKYDLKTETKTVPGQGKQIGFIAQELEKQYPELVSTDSDGTKSVAYDKITAILLQAIKEQESEMKTQQKEIDGLKAEVELIKQNH